MSRWISLYWAWLLPLLATLGVLIRLRALRLARRRELITRPAWRWMLTALAAAQLLIWLAQLAVVYQTNLWWPGLGLSLVGLMLFALRAARSGVHPGLHGLQRSLPRDGLDLIEREQHPRRRRERPLWLPLLPALGLLFYIASLHPERWPELASLALALLAPLLLIPYRRYWLSPLLLALPVTLLLAQAVTLNSGLPPGSWITPVTGAPCNGQLRVADHLAWCVNSFTGVVYQFDLGTGVVTSQTHVFEAVRVFAANDERSWIQQNPARGLVEVVAESAAATPVHVRNTYTGAADFENRLWAVDVGSELLVYANGQVIPLRSRDGLLNNTASTVKVSPRGDVWVGSIGGVSWLAAGETKWRTLDMQSGLPGAVRNLAFAPDRSGTVWLLWQTRGGGSWGVIALVADGTLRNKVDLGALTGLEAPLPEDALAVDGLGRVWFASQSILRREKILGLLTIQEEPVLEVYSLGTFSMTGPYAYGRGLWEDSFGVAADGSGGIILFNGDSEPWRRWRP